MLRADLLGNGQHLFGHRHLQIHARLQDITNPADIVILNMAAIFTQVQRDAIGTGLLSLDGGLHRIRITNPTRLSDCGDMVDINTQQNTLMRNHNFSLDIVKDGPDSKPWNYWPVYLTLVAIPNGLFSTNALLTDKLWLVFPGKQHAALQRSFANQGGHSLTQQPFKARVVFRIGEISLSQRPEQLG